MKRIARSVVVALFFVAFVTGSRTSGCSCDAPPQPAPNQVSAVQGPRFGNEIRRESPPLMAPGNPPPKVEPMVLFDGVAGIYFYFETDGQHATAVARRFGDLARKMWLSTPRVTPPSTDPGLQKLWVVVDWAGPPSDRNLQNTKRMGKPGEYIGIAFNTSQRDFSTSSPVSTFLLEATILELPLPGAHISVGDLTIRTNFKPALQTTSDALRRSAPGLPALRACRSNPNPCRKTAHSPAGRRSRRSESSRPA